MRAAACCDMSKEGELRNIYLFLTADALLLGVSDRTGEMAYAGAQPFRHREPEGIGEWIELSLPRLGKPRILNQVVGGLLTLELDGAETWICRFSGTKMREMQRFTRKLEAAIEDQALPAGAGIGGGGILPEMRGALSRPGPRGLSEMFGKAYGVHADPGVFQGV